MVPLREYCPLVLAPPPPETLYQSTVYCWPNTRRPKDEFRMRQPRASVAIPAGRRSTESPLRLDCSSFCPVLDSECSPVQKGKSAKEQKSKTKTPLHNEIRRHCRQPSGYSRGRSEE